MEHGTTSPGGDGAVIEVRGLTYAYPGAAPVLDRLNLGIGAGEFVALVGSNGSGKSTLARILCGLQAGASAESALVCACDVTTDKGRRAARRSAGLLFQDPENQIIGATVEDDVAFGLENLGEPADRMRVRVDEMLARFDLTALRTREPHQLSGGQKQRTALAGVLALPRRLLVLDEPTAMLDAEGRREVLDAVRDLRGGELTIVYITQDMDEVPRFDRAVALSAGQIAFDGRPEQLLDREDLVEELGLDTPVAVRIAQGLRRLGRPIEPLPLTIPALADAAGGMLGHRHAQPEARAAAPPPACRQSGAASGRASDRSASAAPHVVCEGLKFSYQSGGDQVPAVVDFDLDLPPGSATALLGPSGAGKSTLLLLLRGLLEAQSGRVLLDGVAAEDAGRGAVRRRIGLVFQRAEIQLFAQSAWEDVAFGPRRLGLPDDLVRISVDEAMATVGLPAAVFGSRHPYALSGGEQRRLALAGVLAMRPGALLLDEPFVSLDPAGRRDLLELLKRLRDQGLTILLATHDADAAWALCPRRVVMAAGAVIADGPWAFDEGGAEILEAHGIELPAHVDLWRRLGLPLDEAPRSADAAARMLA